MSDLGKTIQTDFPLFSKHPGLAYLDNAATTQIPQITIEAITDFYTSNNANIHRGLYDLSASISTAYEAVRKKTADLMHTQAENIFFTSGTTASINMIAQMQSEFVFAGDKIVVTELEHHSNFLPWQRLANDKDASFDVIPVDTETSALQIESQDSFITKQTKIVALTYRSNVTGTKTPLEKIITAAKKVDACIVVDAAQATWYELAEIVAMDPDFVVFSTHKLYGPKGLGIVYGKKETLTACEPAILGGGMVNHVTTQKATWRDVPHRFEAGTPPIASVLGWGSTIDYLVRLNVEAIEEHLYELRSFILKELKKRSYIKIIGSNHDAGIISFVLSDMHVHDVAEILNDNDVAVRAGHHCAEPLMQALRLPGCIRISCGIYNTKKDIKQCLDALDTAHRLFS